MTDFLLELRSEEIPARMQAKAKDDLARLFAEEIAKAGLKTDTIETFATPRRLALIARGLPTQTQGVSEERKGPRANAPEQALAGFLRSTGLTREQLTERDGVFFAIIDKPGRPTTEVLAEAVPTIIRAFPWPKSMRWGDASIGTESLRWVRPLQGIVALFGEQIVECEIDGIFSGAATMGHRFHHAGPITIGSADDYVEKLRMCHVIVHLSERMTLIRDGAAKAAAAAGLTVIPDEGLIAENAGLTEWPEPLLGRFDRAFLDVPREVIQLTMRTNQKYFACVDADGKLANAFVCTANIDAHDGGAAVIAGNEKVLSARLSDAKFFWEADLKVPLEEQAAKLSQIVFHEKLGTVADKAERVAKLARWLVEEEIITNRIPERSRGALPSEAEALSDECAILGFARTSPSATLGKAELADLAETAAYLCKADLVTGMVGEFPELQGIMGGYYAAAQSHPPEVAAAIRDHYKPVGQGDEVPTAPVTVAVSLADKLDTLLSFFAVYERPTGSRDPFALRRAALGVLELIVVNHLRGHLRYWLTEAYRLLIDQIVAAKIVVNWDVEGDHQRIRTQGLRHFRERLAVLVDVPVDRLPSGDTEFYSAGANVDVLLNFVIDRFTATIETLTDYIFDRMEERQRRIGARYDLLRAVLPKNEHDMGMIDLEDSQFDLGKIRLHNYNIEDDLVRLLARVKALQAFVTTDEGANLLTGYKRAANILKKSPLPLGRGDSPAGERGRVSETVALEHPHPTLPLEGEGLKITLSYTEEKAEQSLKDALDSAEPRATAAIEREDFEGAMSALATLRAPIDAFFETVTVNDPDPAKRAARLALLTRMRDAVHRVADFSKIEG